MKKHLMQQLNPSQIYKSSLFTNTLLMLCLLALFFLYLYPSFSNFFVGDDFTWLKWAAQSDNGTLVRNFYDAQGFFFRPIDKLFIYLQYSFFSLNPFMYHVVNLFFNFSCSVAVYFLLQIVFKKKRTAFLGAFLFSFIPSHSQNLFWIATISTTISAGFILFGLLAFYYARVRKSIFLYVLSLVLFLLSVFSYENAIIFIGLIALFDLFLIDRKYKKHKVVFFIPYVISAGIIGLYLYLRINANAAGFSGDYNYNLIKVLPNSAGNYIGYVLAFFASENSFALYNAARNNLKSYFLFISVIGFLVFAFIGGFFIEHKEKIRLAQPVKLFFFGFLFSVVSLMTYLPLGNITLRYIYLPTFGFVVMSLIVFEFCMSKVKDKWVNHTLYVIVLFLIGAWCYVQLQTAESYWAKASNVTLYTMNSLVKQDIQDNTHLYFYNIPTKTGEAYIFPVGLPDLVYFVNPSPTIYTFIVSDRQKAEVLKNTIGKKVSNSWIFTFDKDFLLQMVDNRTSNEE